MAYSVKTPWEGHTDGIPLTLDYPSGTMYDAIARVAHRFPAAVALDFMGRSTTFRALLARIDRLAGSLTALGIGRGDTVTIAMPNCPQAVAAFYAINRIGAVANMIHPLSAEKEIEFYLNEAASETVITLDQFYEKIERVRATTPLRRILIAKISDEMPPLLSLGYALTEGRKIPPVRKGAPYVILWDELLKMQKTPPAKQTVDTDAAVILYSGGTTGKTKGIVLTNRNFNALAVQIVTTNPMFTPGDRMLAAMPVFHGFGLGVCIHSMLFNGGRCLLVPRFTPASLAKIITKEPLQFMAGVPTLYEALLRLPDLEKADLSALKGVFSGGDSLSVELKRKLDAFLRAHGASISVREGYGTTETVTACCLTPPHTAKEGSIGVPFPDTYMKVVVPGTETEVPYGEEGEILLAGPTVMKEYLHHPEEIEKTLRVHQDGLTWVYTGDLGTMDEEGFVYFKGRQKRMIVTSGYNVYPNQIENILDAHPLIHMSCVIGVPDDYRMHRVKAFVMLKPDVPPTEETRQKIFDYCREHIARYAMPREIEFREELPKTLVGKVAYRKLEEEIAQNV